MCRAPMKTDYLNEPVLRVYSRVDSLFIFENIDCYLDYNIFFQYYPYQDLWNSYLLSYYKQHPLGGDINYITQVDWEYVFKHVKSKSNIKLLLDRFGIKFEQLNNNLSIISRKHLKYILEIKKWTLIKIKKIIYGILPNDSDFVEKVKMLVDYADDFGLTLDNKVYLYIITVCIHFYYVKYFIYFVKRLDKTEFPDSLCEYVISNCRRDRITGRRCQIQILLDNDILQNYSGKKNLILLAHSNGLYRPFKCSNYKIGFINRFYIGYKNIIKRLLKYESD